MSKIKIAVSWGIIILLGAGLYFLFDSRKPDVQDTATSTAMFTPVVGEPELYYPIDRQNRIDHVIATKGKDYQRFSLTKTGAKNLIITHHQQGILVFEEKEFEKIKLIWESTEDISDPRSKVGVSDLTGDGVNEILALWDNDKGETLYIYKWNSDGFDMITPYLIHIRPDGKESNYVGFGGEESMTKIFDVDKDGIPEIVQPYNIFLGLAENRLDVINKKVYRAYKWDGSKYFLWREQKDSLTPSTGEDQYSVGNVLYPP